MDRKKLQNGRPHVTVFDIPRFKTGGFRFTSDRVHQERSSP
jgi:hypothetical protein